MTSNENISRGILVNQTLNAGIDITGNFLKSFLETIMNKATLAIRIVNGDELEIRNPVLNIATTTISNNNTVVLRVITTITLSFLNLVIESLDFLHTRVTLARRATRPVLDGTDITIRNLRVIINIDSQIGVEGRSG